jgi:transcriptional regulator with XRE-family HTH domain
VKRGKSSKENNVVTLKEVAKQVGLTPGTVSAVLNNSAASRSIPETTRQRILAAARELNYRPNMLARSLRVQRTFTIGVILQEIGDAYGSTVVSGIEEVLSERDFFFLTVAHRHDKKLLQTYSDLLISRGVEGFITVDTSISEKPVLPNVPTYICAEADDLKYVLENLDKLVIKAANESGGYGMLIGPHASPEQRQEFAEKVQANPRNYIAQPTLALSCVPTLVGDHFEGRHVDLRPYTLYGKDIFVLPGGLTRVALKKGSLVVNSSQGGGSKDTWVLADAPVPEQDEFTPPPPREAATA